MRAILCGRFSAARRAAALSTTTPPPPSAFYPPIINQIPQISYEDFLRADANKDGRISSVEWENYVRSKYLQAQSTTLLQAQGCTIHLPVSSEFIQSLLVNQAFGISLNGNQYTLQLQPVGKTLELIAEAQQKLEETRDKIRKMELVKLPLDRAASRHTNRVMSALLCYLFAQAAVVAKLTFFSRFGWDIMEPVTYFITFGISLGGFTFFTWNRLEFTYPALAGLLARRKAEKLYKKWGFNEQELNELKIKEAKILAQLTALLAART